MVNFILSSILGGIGYSIPKHIRKYSIGIYIASVVIALLTYFQIVEGFTLIYDGFVGLAFFIVVMYAGAFNKSSKVSKRLRSVRKEYSIIGFILLIPHFINFLIQFLFKDYPWEFYGVIAAVIMLPLFIISFSNIKKKFEIKSWIKLQKYAYLAYLFTYIHLFVVAEKPHPIIYTVIFGVYAVLKFKNYIISSNVKSKIIYSGMIITAILLALSSVITTLSKPIQPKTTIKNSYYGSAKGYKNFYVEVMVDMEDDQIVSITLDKCGCTSPHRGVNFQNAAYQTIADIISKQSVRVDTIAGATKTTTGVIDAVSQALSNHQTNTE